ncbi:MAG: pyridoxamine 5'-phosphate oxidase family protein [Xanthobacteraceae bacterium]
MSDNPHLDRVWDIIERVGVAMLTTHSVGGFRARPVEPRLDRAAGLIWIVTDLRSGKEHEIEAEHHVGIVCVEAKERAYLSITARAEVLPDHAKAAEIWRFTDNLWWKGPDDPTASACHAADGGIVGRTGQQGRCGVRVRQGPAHRRKTEPGREPQGHCGLG